MPVSNDKLYKPEEALHELQVQETILKTAIDVQVVLRILVDKEIVTREEVQKYREEVRLQESAPAPRPDIRILYPPIFMFSLASSYNTAFTALAHRSSRLNLIFG